MDGGSGEESGIQSVRARIELFGISVGWGLAKCPLRLLYARVDASNGYDGRPDIQSRLAQE